MSIFTVYNYDCETKEVGLELHDLVDCICGDTSTDQVPACKGEWAMVEYGTICRHLGFDPRLPIFIPALGRGVTAHAPLYPWEDQPYAFNMFDDDGKVVPPEPVKQESAYGKKSDYETKENPFGWVDHTKAQFVINIHHCTPKKFSLRQPIFLGQWN
jgi:hypothetical protein